MFCSSSRNFALKDISIWLLKCTFLPFILLVFVFSDETLLCGFLSWLSDVRLHTASVEWKFGFGISFCLNLVDITSGMRS